MNTYFKTLKSILEGKDAITFFSGAGLSVSSGLPDFRSDKDGFWKSNTPVHFRDFINNSESRKKSWENNLAIHKKISGAVPTKMHNLINELINKNTKNFHITQNIDGLDGKAGNKNYIAIHGRLDQMTVFHHQGDNVTPQATLWSNVDESNLHRSLLALFNIENHQPKLNHSLKPFVLLFDEYYTELYRITEAQQRMIDADKMVFMGTSFSVNITQMALEIARSYSIPIEIVDPDPTHVFHSNVTYHKMTALEYVQLQG